MSNTTGYNSSAAEYNNTNPMDPCYNNMMERRASIMAGRNMTINNNSNDSKSIATCDSSNSTVVYNNNPASIISSSTNSKLVAA